MANEVYVSAQGDTLATHIFVRRMEMLLHQRPFMRRLASYKGNTRGSNSDTLKVGQVDHDDIAESVAEGAAVTGNTAITDSSFTLTPARKAIKRTLSDKMAGVDGTGLFNELALAMYNFQAVMKAFDAAYATAMASLTGTAGVSGAAMTADVWFTATQTLRTRRVRGKKAAVFHPHQFNQLQSDLRGEVGPWQLNEEVQAAVATSSGDDLVAYLQGIPIWTSDQVADANAGADHGGGIMQIPDDASEVDGRYVGDAAIAFAEGAVPGTTLGGGRVVEADAIVYTDFKINLDKAEVEMATNYFVSVAVALAGRGIKVITDHS
jgi:hypothetical protein